MEQVHKTKAKIVGLYLLFLFLFLIISHVMVIDVNNWIDSFLEQGKPLRISYYNHIYVILFYIILSTYYMLKALNIYINKKVAILIELVGYLFGLIGLYKFWCLRGFLSGMMVINGFVLGLDEIYKKDKLKMEC